jgi:hypothetical protein
VKGSERQKRADAGCGIRDTSRKRKIKVANCRCEIDMNPKSDNEKFEIQNQIQKGQAKQESISLNFLSLTIRA